jgi:hypothetical protein
MAMKPLDTSIITSLLALALITRERVRRVAKASFSP